MKINWRRKKCWIIKTPVKKVHKIQTPDTVYNRDKEKEIGRRAIEKGVNGIEEN